jgi:cyanophycinase
MTMRSVYYVLVLGLMVAGCGQDMSASPDAPQAVNGTGQLFIIGGGSRPPAMIDRMVAAAGVRDGGYAVILPMASSEPDAAADAIEEQLAGSGASDVRTLIAGADAPASDEQRALVEKAALVYMPGGSQSRLMDALSGSGLDDAIRTAYREGALIAGTSAGAAVMSAQMITGDTQRYDEYHSTFRTIETDNIVLEDGLGLVETAIVDQHFLYRSRHNRLLTAILEDPSITGLGIDESTAVLLDGTEAEVVGDWQVLVFTNPERSVQRQDGKFGARNLRVDIYLPGETFTLARAPE